MGERGTPTKDPSVDLRGGPFEHDAGIAEEARVLVIADDACSPRIWSRTCDLEAG
jgi:hypothetical protein